MNIRESSCGIVLPSQNDAEELRKTIVELEKEVKEKMSKGAKIGTKYTSRKKLIQMFPDLANRIGKTETLPTAKKNKLTPQNQFEDFCNRKGIK